MSRIDFYHLQKQTLEEVLPKLLMKSYSSGKKVVIKIGTEERLEQMNSYLWTFQDESFLPHGSKKDGFAEQQPIWLTLQDDNPNAAEFLFLILAFFHFYVWQCFIWQFVEYFRINALFLLFPCIIYWI